MKKATLLTGCDKIIDIQDNFLYLYHAKARSYQSMSMLVEMGIRLMKSSSILKA